MKYFIGGFTWDGVSQFDRFIKDGIWENGYEEDKYSDLFSEIRVGDLFALKSTFVKGRKPNAKSYLRIKKIGVVTQIVDTHTIKINWYDDIKEFDLTNIRWYANTLEKITNPVDIYRIFGNVKTVKMIQEIKTILENKKQIILQGAPGTGKTYTSAEIALSIVNNEFKNYSSREELMKDYKKAVENGYITFTTFHQSLDYEEFIEGIKPNTENGNIAYEVEDGLFKKLCNRAKIKNENNFEVAYNMLINEIKEAENEILILNTKTGKPFGISINRNGNLNLHTGKELTKQGTLTKDNILKQLSGINTFEGWDSYFWGVINHLKEKHNFKENITNKKQNYVLIIDEINRGNISKIFGELITLLENDKRLGEENEITLKLPYSNEYFGVPSNLYIIGTMNTADRSIGHIDYAVRRRFAFITLKAKKEKVSNYYISKGLDNNLKQKAEKLFDEVYMIVTQNIAPDFDENDLMIGHSYFMANSEEELKLKLEYEIKPLLFEYVKDGILFMLKEDGNKIENLII